LFCKKQKQSQLKKIVEDLSAKTEMAAKDIDETAKEVRPYTFKFQLAIGYKIPMIDDFVLLQLPPNSPTG
jgi:hypothetical protein